VHAHVKKLSVVMVPDVIAEMQRVDARAKGTFHQCHLAPAVRLRASCKYRNERQTIENTTGCSTAEIQHRRGMIDVRRHCGGAILTHTRPDDRQRKPRRLVI